MDLNKKYILKLVLISIVLFSIYQFAVYIDQNLTVSSEDMKNYAQTYIGTYREIANGNISSRNLTYLEFYNKYPYLVRIIISTTHGAGLEFFPSKVASSKIEITNKEIEKYMFNGSTDVVMFRVAGHASIGDLTLECTQSPFKILDSGSLLIYHLRVNNSWQAGRIYEYAIIKGSNQKRDWAVQAASNDARADFEDSLIEVFEKSEEFRDYLAQPILSNIANDIVNKNKNGSYRNNPLLFKNDIEKLHKAAIERGASTQFADVALSVAKNQPEPISWLDQYHVWDMLRSLIVSLIISPAIMYFINKFKPKIFGPKSRKRKRRS